MNMLLGALGATAGCRIFLISSALAAAMLIATRLGIKNLSSLSTEVRGLRSKMRRMGRGEITPQEGIEEELESKENALRSAQLTTVGTIASMLWVLGGLLIWLLGGDKPNEIGDAFGAVNAGFSTLATVGVVYAILLQHDELSLQRDELHETRLELKNTREVHEEAKAIQALSIKAESIRRKVDDLEHLRLEVARLSGRHEQLASDIAANAPTKDGISVSAPLLYSAHAQVQAELAKAKAVKAAGINWPTVNFHPLQSAFSLLLDDANRAIDCLKENHRYFRPSNSRRGQFDSVLTSIANESKTLCAELERIRKKLDSVNLEHPLITPSATGESRPPAEPGPADP